MTYCLMTEDKKLRIEIQCSVVHRPDNVLQLIQGISNGTIDMIRPKKVKGSFYNRFPDGQPLSLVKLDTDWERNGVQPMYINWIPTENL